MTKGKYKSDKLLSEVESPSCKMYTLGHDYDIPDIHATGLRFHGLSPILSYLLYKKQFIPVALSQDECIIAAKILAKTEGIISAPESYYSIAYVIREARKNDKAVILSTITGNGFLDLNIFENDQHTL